MHSRTRNPNGKYHIHGKDYDLLEGSRAQVWHETAHETSGGLTKSHLMKNKLGRIVSKKKTSNCEKRKTFRKSRIFYEKRRIRCGSERYLHEKQ
jgi:hypothetical protein